MGNLSAFGYFAGWRFVRILPESWAIRLFDFGADYVSDQGRGLDNLRNNLIRVVGAENVTRALVRKAMRSYARYWREAFRLSSMVSPELLAELRASVTGREHIEKALESGRGVILVLPHSGNWDMAGLWLASDFGTFTTVAERLRPESLFQAFVQFRESLGFRVLPDRGDEIRPYEQLALVLRDGGIVALLGERDIRGTGIPVEFFSESTTMPAGPAALALETGASLHVAHCFFTPQGWGFTISPEVCGDRVEDLVQRIAWRFEEGISAHPEDWHVLQPIWRST
ncbi:phosphatidylinositol mannoside acyltransferase [Corynebacterium freiburgense]|uniref:phosphatidylinositol mannoside acyltransferase n=1 Tax=Corynebacterium freiburgense TaxID=556548 RepID=UPI000401AEFD|nr:phosphatidylinositol mannoside acyltransferase [Corynebacterium freiburgense]WJZ02835.1 Phosphatidylinositol mannoside acyltransferase [Corynebacterium freiburgense]